MRLALVYLARGVGNGLDAADAFFTAYKTYPAGCEHDLIVICKGWYDAEERRRLFKMAYDIGAEIVSMPDQGLDFGAYMRIAPSLPHDWVCFLSTNSRPLVKDWLKKMFIVAQGSEDIGLVGPTGSLGSIAGIYVPRISFSGLGSVIQYLVLPLRVAKSLLLYIIKLRDFKSFPNPHIRSSSFMVKTCLFKAFSSVRSIPNSKYGAYILESGRRGLSRYILRQGYSIRVVGADGISYEYPQWHESCTFRSGSQSNLLIADRQTDVYKSSDSKARLIVEEVTWGNM